MIGWLRRWRQWRERALLARRKIPDALWSLTLTRLPFLGQLTVDDQAELQRLTTLFLTQKEFTGIAGLQVDDEMAVSIAAQACLPVLRFGLGPYSGFVGIVVHAGEVLANRSVMDDDGVVHEYDELVTGEAMEGGPVMLSWRDVDEAGASADWGYNVVIHEFAHVLDMGDGAADGVPVLPVSMDRQAWLQQMEASFAAHCADVEDGLDTVLDPYGATGIDEFFAVASEAFFVTPQRLRDEHAALYLMLARYFQQNPAQR